MEEITTFYDCEPQELDSINTNEKLTDTGIEQLTDKKQSVELNRETEGIETQEKFQNPWENDSILDKIISELVPDHEAFSNGPIEMTPEKLDKQKVDYKENPTHTITNSSDYYTCFIQSEDGVEKELEGKSCRDQVLYSENGIDKEMCSKVETTNGKIGVPANIGSIIPINDRVTNSPDMLSEGCIETQNNPPVEKTLKIEVANERDIDYKTISEKESGSDAFSNKNFNDYIKNRFSPNLMQELNLEFDQERLMKGLVNDIVKLAVKFTQELLTQEINQISYVASLGYEGNKQESKGIMKSSEFEKDEYRFCKKSELTIALCPETDSENEVGNSQESGNEENNWTTCQLCDKEGHFANECYKRLSLNSNAFQSNNSTHIICQLCGKRGHTADSCFKLFPLPRKNNNYRDTIYQRHRKSKYVKEQSINDQMTEGVRLRELETSCQICGREGHRANICPLRFNSAQYLNANKNLCASDPKHNNCHYCKKPGHYIRECPARRVHKKDHTNVKEEGNNLSLTSISEPTISNVHSIVISNSGQE